MPSTMIAEAMQKVGNEGVITVQEAKSLETELDVTNSGFPSSRDLWTEERLRSNSFPAQGFEL